MKYQECYLLTQWAVDREKAWGTDAWLGWSFQACPLDPGNPAWYNRDPRKSFKLWGKNTQAEVKINDYDTAEEYWEAVRINAAKNLDANSAKHRS